MSAKKTDTKKVPVKQAKNRHSTRTSWKPGQSGNVKGRPPLRDSLAETFRDYLDDRGKSGRIRKNLLIERLFALTDGTGAAVSAARLICDIVSGFEVEERLQALERKVDTVLSGNHRGRG